MPTPPLQNFVDQLTVVKAAWLNSVDQVVTTVFEQTVTKPAARAALVDDLTSVGKGFEIINGGTGATDGLNLSFRGVDSGVVNAYIVTATGLANPLSSIPTATLLRFIATTPNTGPATLSLNGSTPAAIVNTASAALTGGELSGLQFVSWTGTQWQLVSPAIGLPYARTAAERAVGVVPSIYTYLPGDARRYGVVGDGVIDDTAALQRALSVQQDVFVTAGLTCLISSPLTLLSNQTLYGLGHESQIYMSAGVNTNAVVLSGVTRSVVRDIFVRYVGTSNSGLNGSAIAVLAGSTYCVVRGCRAEGVQGAITVNVSDYTTIDDNLISFVGPTTPSTQNWDIAVYLGGNYNRVTRNRCYGGSSIAIQIESDATHSCNDNIVAANHVTQHTGYGIICYSAGAGTLKNSIVNNVIQDILGTTLSGPSNQPFGAGIYIQSAELTSVVGNVIENTNVSTNVQQLAPGGIGVANTSCFTVTGNVVNNPNWYGICAITDGVGSGGGIISDNAIVCNANTHGAIFLSAITNVTVNGNTASLPVTANAVGLQYTNSVTGTGITITNNRLVGFVNNTGILLDHLQGIRVLGNYVRGANVGMQTTTCIGGTVCDNEFRNSANTDVQIDGTNSGLIFFDRNTVRSAATNGVNDSVGLIYGVNDVAGQTNPFTGSVSFERPINTASATPSVPGSRWASDAGSATAVTDLLNPFPGQIITILAGGARTYQHNTGAAGTKLILNGAVNFSMVANNTLTLEYRSSVGPWYEIARKV